VTVCRPNGKTQNAPDVGWPLLNQWVAPFRLLVRATGQETRHLGSALSLSEASYADEREDNIMRTIAKAALALTFVGAMAIGGTGSVKARGFSLNRPGAHVQAGHRHHRTPRYYDYAPSYAGLGVGMPRGLHGAERRL
jgi:hypothetical protein